MQVKKTLKKYQIILLEALKYVFTAADRHILKCFFLRIYAYGKHGVHLSHQYYKASLSQTLDNIETHAA